MCSSRVVIGREGLKHFRGGAWAMFQISKQTMRAVICGRQQGPDPSPVDTHFSDARRTCDTEGKNAMNAWCIEGLMECTNDPAAGRWHSAWVKISQLERLKSNVLLIHESPWESDSVQHKPLMYPRIRRILSRIPRNDLRLVTMQLSAGSWITTLTVNKGYIATNLYGCIKARYPST